MLRYLSLINVCLVSIFIKNYSLFCLHFLCLSTCHFWTGGPLSDIRPPSGYVPPGVCNLIVNNDWIDWFIDWLIALIVPIAVLVYNCMTSLTDCIITPSERVTDVKCINIDIPRMCWIRSADVPGAIVQLHFSFQEYTPCMCARDIIRMCYAHDTFMSASSARCFPRRIYSVRRRHCATDNGMRTLMQQGPMQREHTYCRLYKFRDH